MTALWPSNLPNIVLVDGFTVGQADGRLQSEPDSGPPKVRLLTSARPTPVAAQLHLDGPTHSGRFDRFWAETLKRGALPFLIRDLLSLSNRV